jgi:hypothetical protein
MPDQPNPAAPLLEPRETAVVPSTTAPALVGDLFKKNRVIQIASIFGEFKSRFFDKTEPALPETTYRKFTLLHIAPDAPIIAELGGPAKVAGTITAAIALLVRQPNGAPGFLQTSGYANIFYSKDKKGVLCAIRIGWTEGGWVVDAIPVDDPLAWNGKHEIFCPIAPVAAIHESSE